MLDRTTVPKVCFTVLPPLQGSKPEDSSGPMEQRCSNSWEGRTGVGGEGVGGPSKDYNLHPNHGIVQWREWEEKWTSKKILEWTVKENLEWKSSREGVSGLDSYTRREEESLLDV